ncbi:hypothetical protein [Cellulosimicrobium cellulans]|uniref:hypothetical protein n=1 Tax=Cellulosimicrobium cellulans TaxID=1710 RepID=UPI0008488E82|nr:hypothetical protein [Cellulosimicrobium cellulans]
MAPLSYTVVPQTDPVYAAVVEASQSRAQGDRSAPYAVRSKASDEIVVVTFGSSTCPSVPRFGLWGDGDALTSAAYHMEIGSAVLGNEAEDAEVQACTDDLQATVFRVVVGDVPSGDLRVVFRQTIQAGMTVLPATATDDGR